MIFWTLWFLAGFLTVIYMVCIDMTEKSSLTIEDVALYSMFVVFGTLFGFVAVITGVIMLWNENDWGDIVIWKRYVD